MADFSPARRDRIIAPPDIGCRPANMREYPHGYSNLRTVWMHIQPLPKRSREAAILWSEVPSRWPRPAARRPLLGEGQQGWPNPGTPALSRTMLGLDRGEEPCWLWPHLRPRASRHCDGTPRLASDGDRSADPTGHRDRPSLSEHQLREPSASQRGAAPDECSATRPGESREVGCDPLQAWPRLLPREHTHRGQRHEALS
jgi:hypothetical protein